MLALGLPSRQENFLLTLAIGVLFLVGHVFAYWRYVTDPHPAMGIAVSILLPLGLSFVYAGAHQFFSRGYPFGRAFAACAASIVLVVPPAATGFDGIAWIMQNLLAGTFLLMAAAIYGRHFRQIPAILLLLSALHLACALSFYACGFVILWTRQWVIGHAPDNWAERLNIVVSVSCLTAVGALILALNQMRQARRHKADSMTDPLTGLLNRRALFEIHENRPFGPDAAIAMFDLDNFKPVNDVYGHLVGDEVLRHFAAAAAKHSRPRDDVVRLGGEEFGLIMRGVTAEQAREVVERIAAAFADDTVLTPTGPLRCTVSAGIGFGCDGGSGLEEVLERADKALYAAKRGGRNRVEFDPDRFRLAG